MCFVLYAGSENSIPTIAWDESARALHCCELSEHELAVQKQFRAANVMYVGSDLNCGCGYRSAMYQGGDWPEEEAIGQDWYDLSSDETDYDANHQQLHGFIGSLLNNTKQVELYGCQSGEEEGLCKSELAITLDDLVRPTFMFRERGHYTVIKE